MDKAEHGKRLATAMASRRFDRQVVADATERDVRTVTNWTRGRTMPSDRERATLRRLLGDYDNPGDPVEVAVRSSELDDWRQDLVMSEYRKNLAQQRAEAALSEPRPTLRSVAKPGGLEPEEGDLNEP